MFFDKKSNKFFLLTVFPVLLLLFCLSCTNNSKPSYRFPDNFQQGSADDLYNVSEILGDYPVLESKPVLFAPKDSSSPYPALSSKGGYPQDMLNSENLSKLVQLKTVSRGQKVAISSAQENIEIVSISFINKYEILDYEILNATSSPSHKYIAELIGKVEKFKGFPDTTYSILPVFEGHHLILYKLGPKNKIPYDELPLAKRVGDLLAVPFIGYPIRYCVPEVIPDSNDRKTGQSIPQCEGISLKMAKYIELKKRNKKIFKYIKKPDLFPRDFFTLKDETNNWFYMRTIVKAPRKEEVGHQFFSAANLVEFKPSEDNKKLDVLDASGYNIKEEDKIGALFIPVEWVDYQIKKDSENLHASFSEELKKDTQTKDLRYVKIQFDKLLDNEFTVNGVSILKKTLKKVFITDNYFSFNIELTAENSGAYLIKYAFYKKKSANPPYVPKQWFEKDSSQYFPSFAKERKYYDTADLHSEEDHNQFLRLTRFNPKAKEITWYFSKQTPKDNNTWIRELGHLAVKLLNKAFEKAGEDSDYKIKVVLNESVDQEVGDIRYNILNLMLPEGKPDKGLLGLGPNIANPITGEIVSATANVWVTDILNIYTKIVQQHIRFQIYQPSWFLQPFTKEITEDLKNKLYKSICNNESACMDLPFKPLGVSPFYHEKIKAICPEVTSFIDAHKHLYDVSKIDSHFHNFIETQLTYDPENPDLSDKNIINTCVKKIAFLPILGVTLHEMLHGLGQRHVFSASVDTENFYRDYKEIEGKEGIFETLVSDTMKDIFKEDLPYVKGVKFHPQPPKYSSVMDYMDFYNPILFVPGKLDIAALRFIYFDKVDLQNGEFLEVPAGADSDSENPQKSINQTAQEKEKEPRQYNILCGGDKDYRSETNPEQPLCKRSDYGENPLEIVVNSILYFNNHVLMNERYRYDSKEPQLSSTKTLYIKTINKIVGDLYKKWQEKRDEVLSSIDKTIEDYAFFDPQHVRNYKCVIEPEEEAEKNSDDTCITGEEAEKNSDFKSYYDIREPIFTYLQRLLFMPSKHCIYENDLGEYQAIAFQSIKNFATADYVNYPENSKEKLIDCQSPVAQSLIEKKGQLVAEVGFIGKSSFYFLRPRGRQNDESFDEIFAFDILEELTKQESSKKVGENINAGQPLFINLIKEPDFGQKYYENILSYMLEGTHLTPYIHPDFIRDEDFLEALSHQPNLMKPVLSYNTDKEHSSLLIDIEGIFRNRLSILESAIKNLKNNNLFEEELKSLFGWELRELKDIDNPPSADYPFFQQTSQEYQFLNDFIRVSIRAEEWPQTKFFSIGDFRRNHPTSLYNNNFKPLWIVIPWTIEKDNLPARLFRRVNEFKNCLKAKNCEHSADKKAYIDSIERHYYQEIIE